MTPDGELLARIDERVKTIFNELTEIKDDVRGIKEKMGVCPMGPEAHAGIVKDIEALKKEQDELRGGRRVAYIIAGGIIAVAGMIVGFLA